jgi:hypothetical protein
MAVAVGVTGGCSGDKPQPPVQEGESPVAAASAPVEPADSGAEASEPAAIKAAGAGEPDALDRPADGDSDRETEALLAHLARARIVGAWPVSKRSFSLKLALKGGADAVFKPLRPGDRSARYEVATFVIGRLLGIDSVPASTMRHISVEKLTRLLGERHPDLAQSLPDELVVDPFKRVTGAAIAWIEDLEPTMLEGKKGRQRLAQLLALDGPSLEDDPLVAQVSTMVVFDHVCGNWDRYSGGNLFVRPGGRRLALIDNNGAFVRGSEGLRRRMTELLDDVDRFPRGLVSALRQLTEAQLERALMQEPWHESYRLLTRKEVRRILERRDQVIARVDALIADIGDSRILAFP